MSADFHDPEAIRAELCASMRHLHVAGVGRLEIRSLKEADQSEVRTLAAKNAADLSASMVASLPALASAIHSRARGVSIGIFESDPRAPWARRLIGIAGAIMSDSEDDTASFAVVVAAPFRGLGLGSALVRVLGEHAARNGTRSLKTRITPSNCAMLAIANRLGFRRERGLGEEPLLLIGTIGARSEQAVMKGSHPPTASRMSIGRIQAGSIEADSMRTGQDGTFQTA